MSKVYRLWTKQKTLEIKWITEECKLMLSFSSILCTTTHYIGSKKEVSRMASKNEEGKDRWQRHRHLWLCFVGFGPPTHLFELWKEKYFTARTLEILVACGCLFNGSESKPQQIHSRMLGSLGLGASGSVIACAKSKRIMKMTPQTIHMHLISFEVNIFPMAVPPSLQTHSQTTPRKQAINTPSWMRIRYCMDLVHAFSSHFLGPAVPAPRECMHQVHIITYPLECGYLQHGGTLATVPRLRTHWGGQRCWLWGHWPQWRARCCSHRRHALSCT